MNVFLHLLYQTELFTHLYFITFLKNTLFPIFKKKCIVCRKVTERAEGIGTFAYICKKPSSLVPLFESIISSGEFIVEEECPYGDGHAAENILEILKTENI